MRVFRLEKFFNNAWVGPMAVYDNTSDSIERALCKQVFAGMPFPAPHLDHPESPFVAGEHICGFSSYRQVLAAFWDAVLVERLIRNFEFTISEYEVPDADVVKCDHQVFYTNTSAEIVTCHTLEIIKQFFLEEKYGEVQTN